MQTVRLNRRSASILNFSCTKLYFAVIKTKWIGLCWCRQKTLQTLLIKRKVRSYPNTHGLMHKGLSGKAPAALPVHCAQLGATISLSWSIFCSCRISKEMFCWCSWVNTGRCLHFKPWHIPEIGRNLYGEYTSWGFSESEVFLKSLGQRGMTEK